MKRCFIFSLTNFNLNYRIVNTFKIPISNIINIYTILGTLNLIVIYCTPIFVWERRLPYFMHVPFGIDQHTIGFILAYLYQFGNVVYAGGTNIIVNVYIFSIFVCVTYYLSLLNSRVQCLGFSSGTTEDWIMTPTSKKSFYKEICSIIELHLKINK